MTSYRRAVLGRVVRYGWAEYRATYPPGVVVGFMLPRVIFQMAFLTFIGGLASHDGQRFAFVGNTVQAVSVVAVVYAGIDVSRDRFEGTIVPIRLSRMPAPLVRLAHSWVYAAQGLLFSAVGTLVVGSVLRYGGLSVHLLAVFPLYALAAVSMVGFGLAVATLAPPDIVTVLINSANATLLVLGGMIAPLSHLGPMTPVSHLLPGVNALLAIRATVDGGPVAGWALAECGVAVFWMAVLVLADRLVAARARRGVDGAGAA